MTGLGFAELAVGYRHTPVLTGLAGQARRGALTVLVGPNGAGKSTLLRTLACLQPPIAGTLHLDGDALPALTPTERARRLAVVLTDRVDVGLLDGRELVALGRHPHTGASGRLGPRDETAVAEAIAAVGAGHLAARRVAELSDGERQRVLTARALAQEPALLLLDEPSAFLDVSARVALLGLLRELSRERGIVVVVSTHDLELALRLADHVWLLDRAGGLRSGTPEELVAAGAVAEVFDTPALAFEPVTGTFALGGTRPGRRAVVVAEQPHRALVGRALARAGWTVVPDGPAEAEVGHRGGARFTVRHDGHALPVEGWSALNAWAAGAAPARLMRAASGAVADGLRAAASVGAYFAVEHGAADPGPGWIPLPDLCGGGAALSTHIAAVTVRLGTTETRVGASIFFQGLAARLASPLLAGAARGVLPDLDPALVHVQNRPGEAPGLLVTRVGGWTGDVGPELLARELVERHLEPLAAAVRRHTPIAAGLLRGNAASALVGALGVLERRGAAGDTRALVAALLRTGPLAGTGTLRPDGFRRNSCCLYYRSSAGGYCGDCALRRTRTEAATAAVTEES